MYIFHFCLSASADINADIHTLLAPTFYCEEAIHVN